MFREKDVLVGQWLGNGVADTRQPRFGLFLLDQDPDQEDQNQNQDQDQDQDQ